MLSSLKFCLFVLSLILEAGLCGKTVITSSIFRIENYLKGGENLIYSLSSELKFINIKQETFGPFFNLKISGMVYIGYRGKIHFLKLKCQIFITFSLLVLKCCNYLKWGQKTYLMLFNFVKVLIF